MNKVQNVPRLKTFLSHLFLFPVALLLLFEEWGWVPLVAFINRLASTIAVWKKVEAAISRLSPAISLCVLLVPMFTLLPLKFLGLYLIDLGHVAKGMSIILTSKILGTAFFARLFTLTLPNLLKLVWFARLYPRWISWKNSLLTYAKSTWPFRFAHLLKVKAKNSMSALIQHH